MPNFTVSVPIDVLLKAEDNAEVRDLLDVPSESVVYSLSASLSGYADTALTNVDAFSGRNALNAMRSDIGFYDNFDDINRYPDNTSIISRVTMPLVGDNPWIVSDGAETNTFLPYVWNGGLRASLSGLAYIGNSVRTQNNGKFSMGFEFTPRSTFYNNTVFNLGQNVSFHSQPMFLPNDTIQPVGVAHINWDMFGVRQPGYYFAGANVTAIPATQTLSCANHDWITGDSLSFSGSTGNTGLTSDYSPEYIYYAIYQDANNIKLASSYLNALSGIPITFGGTNATFAANDAWVPINRKWFSGSLPWIDDSVMDTKSVTYLDASTDLVHFDETTNWANGQKVKIQSVFPEGNSLSGNPLISGNDYYIIFNDVFRRQCRLATTRENALAGQYIDLTNTSTFAAGRVALMGPRREYGAENTLNGNYRYVILFEVDGDILSMTLVGAGTIKFRNRKFQQRIGPTTYWWWEPNGAMYNVGYQTVTDLHAVWAEAPSIRDEYTNKYLLASVKKLAGGDAPINKFKILPRGNLLLDGQTEPLTSEASIVLGGKSGAYDYFGSDRTIANGGHIWTEGGYLASVTGTNLGAYNFGRATMSVAHQTITSPLSTPALTPTAIREIGSAGSMRPGDVETHTIYFSLSGSPDAQIRLYATIYGNVFFDSAAGLDGLTGPAIMTLTKISHTNVSHVMYCKLQKPDGSFLPMVKTSVNNGNINRYGITLETTATNFAGIIVDSIDRQLKRVTYT